MILSAPAYFPAGLLVAGAALVWLYLVHVIPAGRCRDFVRGFGIACLINFAVISCAGAAGASP